MDGGSFFGADNATGRRISPDELKRRLRRCGATRALVASISALQYEAGLGNAQTLRLASADSFFLPMAIAAPMAFKGGLGPLRGQGFRAIAAFPHWPGHGGDFDDLALRHIAQDASAQHLPLFLGLAQRSDFAKVARNLAPTGAKLALRWMRGSGYAALAEAMAVARDCPNVLLDAGMAPQSGGIELLVRTLGADRLFVAANAPFAYEACPYFLVRSSRIAEAERQMILEGTLARLLDLAPEQQGEPAGYAELMATPKIDTLYNIGSFDTIEPEAGDEAVAESIGRFRTEIAILSSMRAIFDDMQVGNAETAAFLDRCPEARGLIAVNPMRPEASLAEIDRYAGDPRFIGVKTIQDDAHGLGLDDERYAPILERIGRMTGWTVMAHPTGLGAAARMHPGITFVSEHGTWRHKENADIPNMMFDICTSTPLVAQTDIADLIDRTGADRVLYASDAPLMSPAFTLGKLASLELEPGHLRAILRDNALKAFPRLRLNAR